MIKRKKKKLRVSNVFAREIDVLAVVNMKNTL